MNIIIKYLLVFCCVVVLVVCGNVLVGEKVEVEEVVEIFVEISVIVIFYNIDIEVSQVNWIGVKLIGDQYVGLIKLNSGELFVENGNIMGGIFELDMNFIVVIDEMGDNMKVKLEGYLKMGDFFEVEKFFIGIFEIVSVVVVEGVEGVIYNVIGNFIMKGIIKSVIILVKVELGENGLVVFIFVFIINCIEWDVMYNFGVIGMVKDKLINDDVVLILNLFVFFQ